VRRGLPPPVPAQHGGSLQHGTLHLGDSLQHGALQDGLLQHEVQHLGGSLQHGALQDGLLQHEVQHLGDSLQHEVQHLVVQHGGFAGPDACPLAVVDTAPECGPAAAPGVAAGETPG
jgi:hypothetical protein